MRRSTLGIPNSTHHTGATSRGQNAPTMPEGVEEALEGQSSQSTDMSTEAPCRAEYAQCDQADATMFRSDTGVFGGQHLRKAGRVTIKRLWLGVGRAGDMAKWLGALVLPEDPGSIPNTTAAYNCLLLQFQGI